MSKALAGPWASMLEAMEPPSTSPPFLLHLPTLLPVNGPYIKRTPLIISQLWSGCWPVFHGALCASRFLYCWGSALSQIVPLVNGVNARALGLTVLGAGYFSGPLPGWVSSVAVVRGTHLQHPIVSPRLVPLP